MNHDPARARSSPSRHGLVLAVALLVAILAILLLDFNAYRWVMPIDEGQWLFYANQALEGKVLYKDIWYQFGPALLFGLKWVMQVAGRTLAAERIYFWFLSLIGLAVLYAFSTTLTKRTTSRLVLCLLALLNSLTCRLMMTNPAFLFRQCFNLLPLYLLFTADQGKGRVKFLLAGFLSMLAILISQETGIFAFVAALTFMLLRHFSLRGRGVSLRGGSLFAVGFLLCISIWSAYCLKEGCLEEYLAVSFGEIFAMTGKFQHIPLPSISFLFENARDLAAYYHVAFTYLPLLASVFTIAFHLSKGQPDAKVISVSVYGIFAFSILLGRGDIYHSTFAGLSLLMLLAYWFEKAWNSNRRLCKPLLLGAITAFYVFVVAANSGNMATLVSDSRPMKPMVYEEKLPYLGNALIPLWQYEAIRGAKHAIEGHTEPDQGLFVFPNSPYYYFFIDRPVRTRFATPIFANTDADRKEIVEDLYSSEYRFIIYEKITFPNIDYDYYCGEILEYLENHYDPFTQVGANTYILARRTDQR